MINWAEPSHILTMLFMFNWIALALKLELTGTLTGVFRGIEGVYKTKEDEKFSKKTSSVDYEDSKVKRMNLIHGNELENLLPGLFTSVAFLFANTAVPRISVAAGWVHCAGGAFFLTLFTALRYTYAVVYFFGLQPWRSIIFMSANATLVIMWIWAIVAIFV